MLKCRMSKKSCQIFIVCSQHRNGQDFSDIAIVLRCYIERENILSIKVSLLMSCRELGNAGSGFPDTELRKRINFVFDFSK